MQAPRQRHGRPEAARATWQQLPKSTQQQRPAHLWFRTVTMVAVAGFLFWLTWRRAAVFSLMVAMLTLVLGLLAPSQYLRLDRLLQAAGKGVAVTLAWLLLAPFYFVVLTPLAWLSRRERSARMGLNFGSQQGSNWQPRGEQKGAQRNLEKPF